jgi:hypothetical protein
LVSGGVVTIQEGKIMKPNVEFENDRVRVTRVKQTGPGKIPPGARNDRLVIYLRDGSITRHEGGRAEDLRRRAGEVVWRARSEHQVEVAQEGEHEVLIVELK